MRRIFGTTPGPVLQASPASWEKAPVSADADAFSLAVTPYAGAQVAFRIGSAAGSALGGRLLVNSLPPNFSTTAGTLNGPQLADGGSLPAGPPDIVAAEASDKSTVARLGFLSGSQLRQMQAGGGGVTPLTMPPGPSAVAGGEPVTAVDPEGGGLIAYPALDSAGLPAVAVRQEFPSGAAQTGIVSGGQGGPVAELSIGRSGAGDGLIAFRQGEAGRYAIVAERASAPPAAFKVKPPKGWQRPNAVRLKWQAAQSTAGGVRYSILIDGRPVKRGLSRRRLHLRPALLGNGVVPVQVQATDGLGQQLLSNRAKLHVDGQRPLVKVTVGKAHGVLIRLTDADSGLVPKASRVSFGDGAHDRGGSKFAHSYARPGHYTVVVGARDQVGNRLWRRLVVRVR
jgi:hypothetical protein